MRKLKKNNYAEIHCNCICSPMFGLATLLHSCLDFDKVPITGLNLCNMSFSFHPLIVVGSAVWCVSSHRIPPSQESLQSLDNNKNWMIKFKNNLHIHHSLTNYYLHIFLALSISTFISFRSTSSKALLISFFSSLVIKIYGTLVTFSTLLTAITGVKCHWWILWHYRKYLCLQ